MASAEKKGGDSTHFGEYVQKNLKLHELRTATALSTHGERPTPALSWVTKRAREKGSTPGRGWDLAGPSTRGGPRPETDTSALPGCGPRKGGILARECSSDLAEGRTQQ